MSAIEIRNFAQDVGIGQKNKVPFGLTVLEMAQVFYKDLDNLTAWIKAPVGASVEWFEVPRAVWGRLRPKIDGVLQFGYRLRNDAIKDVFSIVATVVVAVVAPVLAVSLGPILGAVATAALTAGVSLLSQTLFPVGGANQGLGVSIGTGANEGKNESRNFINVESGNNVLAKESYLPIVAGLRRVSLPEIAQPRAFLDPASGIQTLHRVFALYGQHSITDVQVDGVPVEGNDSFEVEIVDGAEDGPTETFINKISFSEDISAELANFSLNETVLVDQDTPENSQPRWERFKTRFDDRVEAINIRLGFSSMIRSTEAGVSVRVPIRMRLRPLGSQDDWTNLPEMHFIGNRSDTALQEITIRWDNNFGIADQTGDISHQFFQNVPPVTAGPLASGTTGDQWQAHPQFVNGSGLRDVTNISGGRNGLRVQLDPTQTPKAAYEIEIIRGYATDQDDLTLSTYVFSSAVHSFFEGYSVSAGWSVVTDQSDFLARVQLVFATTLINRKPCQRPNTALLAIESKGQSVKNVTALCGAMVPDWNGAEWAGAVVTKNPASHYRRFLIDHYERSGTSTALVENETIEAFHDECAAQGYEVSGVFAGPTAADTISAVAEAGFALPAVDVGIGVDWFRDRSADKPAQTFSPRNSSIKLDYYNGIRPSGIRAKFQNENNNFVDDEIEVNNPFYTSFGVYEVQEYATISNPELVRRRAFFDMLQLDRQSRRAWMVETAIEGLVCKKGDMVGVVTDLLDDASFGARVTEVINDNVFRIDQEIPLVSTKSIYSTANVFGESDVFKVGEQSVIFITTPSGVHESSIIAVEGDLIRIADGLGTLDFNGAHLTIGPVSNFLKRCIVREITALDDENARLVLVDEAPEIFEGMEAKFA